MTEQIESERKDFVSQIATKEKELTLEIKLLQGQIREMDENKIKLDMQVHNLKKELIKHMETNEAMKKQEEEYKTQLRNLNLFKLQFQNQVKQSKMGFNASNRVSGTGVIDQRIRMKSGFMDIEMLNNSIRGRSFSNPLNISSKSHKVGLVSRAQRDNIMLDPSTFGDSNPD